MKFINIHKILSAEIVNPYENTGEAWDITESHGWRLNLTIGNSRSPEMISIDRDGEAECIELAEKLGLTCID